MMNSAGYSGAELWCQVWNFRLGEALSRGADLLDQFFKNAREKEQREIRAPGKISSLIGGAGKPFK